MYVNLEMYITGNGHEIRVIHIGCQEDRKLVVTVCPRETTNLDIEQDVVRDRWNVIVVDGEVVKSIHDALVELDSRLI